VEVAVVTLEDRLDALAAQGDGEVTIAPEERPGP
jgi:hypothetical protein